MEPLLHLEPGGLSRFGSQGFRLYLASENGINGINGVVSMVWDEWCSRHDEKGSWPFVAAAAIAECNNDLGHIFAV